ncbi:MAG TPA: TlpA disulfide reductase family protein [Candidatus Limnocylindrales bacterium]|nr:TlpA disulfide reductase family protein [Candidatus Limnocylindrales bacterium]
MTAPRAPRRGLVGPFSGRQLLAAAMTVVVVAVLLVVVTTPLGSATPIGPNDPQATQFVLNPDAEIGVRPGQLPPELEIVAADGSRQPLTDLAGKPIRLADLRGKAVWLNFWASWCPPCQAETPVVRDVADAFRDRGLVVIGISVQESSPENVAAYAQRYQLDYTIAADSTGQIFRTYGPRGLPTSIFIGPEGAVRSFVLAPLTQARAIAQVEAILPPGASAGPTAIALPSPSPSPSAAP